MKFTEKEITFMILAVQERSFRLQDDLREEEDLEPFYKVGKDRQKLLSKLSELYEKVNTGS